jgi:hypothetical protein
MYNANRSDLVPGSSFWLHGGSAQLDLSYRKGFGIAGDFAEVHASNISTSGVGLDLITLTVGPQYKWVPPSHGDKHSVALFGHFLMGEAHAFNSVFPGPLTSASSASSFGIKMGGGADLRISHHVSVRMVQAEWLRTQLPNGTTGVQNSLQLGAGVAVHLRRERPSVRVAFSDTKGSMLKSNESRQERIERNRLMRSAELQLRHTWMLCCSIVLLCSRYLCFGTNF